MSANRSSAVMQQRHEALDSLDDFPTPPWAVRAMMNALGDGEEAEPWALRSIWEPAANRGALVRGLTGGADIVRASDVHDYGAGFAVFDFLMPGRAPWNEDWVITNPPFRLAERFALRGLEVARRGVALIVRTAFLEGGRRHAALFRDNPPSLILQHCERVIMHRGVLRDPDVEYWNPNANGGEGAMQKPSTATSYAWLICQRDAEAFRRGRSEFRWIPPCRRRFERPGDYAPFPGEAAA